jgi:hypothetical protein
MSMSTGEIISITIGTAITLGGGLWTLFTLAMSNKEKHYDERHATLQKSFEESLDSLESRTNETQKTMWAKIDDSKDEISRLRVENAELKGRIANAPSAEFVGQSIIQLESRIEKRLDLLAEQIQELIKAVIKK